jgi:hypothetical protein
MSADRTWSQLVIARRFSEDTAVAGERPVSYAELIGLADAAAEWLDQAGVPAGTAVPALLTTSPLALALVVAGSCTQRPVAPLGPRLTPRELAGCIDGLDAPLLVAEPEFAEQARAAAQRAGRRLLILPPLDPGGRRLLPEARPDAIAAILHTSGTTGAPKQVPITQDRLAARVGVSSRLMGVGPASVYASGSPFYHIAGLGNLAVMIAVGAAVLPFPRFSVESWTGLGRHPCLSRPDDDRAVAGHRRADAARPAPPAVRIRADPSGHALPGGAGAAGRQFHQHVRADRGEPDRLPRPRRSRPGPGGPAGPARLGRARRARYRAAAGGNRRRGGRRDPRAWCAPVPGRRGRLAAHGGSGQNGRRRLRLPDRAAGRPDQARWRERPSRRGRRRAARAPGRAGGRGGRHTRRGVRSARSRVPGPGSGCPGA